MSKRKYLWLILSIAIFVFVYLILFTNVFPFSLKKESDLEGILEKKKLVLVTSYNPTGYFYYKDEPMGFEYDLIRRFAEQLHVKLKVLEVNRPDEMYNKLLTGEADIMAFNIPVTNLPLQYAVFSNPYIQTELVLVQRKVNKKSPEYVGTLKDLGGKKITIPEQSPYGQTLDDIKFDNNIHFDINTIDASTSTEDLIRMVAESKIDYTIANKEIALINKGFYNNIDIGTSLTAPQDIAFTVHRKNKQLLSALNDFISKSRKDKTLYTLYQRYFKTSRLIAENDDAEDPNDEGNSREAISRYDGLIIRYARSIHWDWRLIAAMIWQESRFQPSARSWAGATGLMQLMPATARRFGLHTMQEIYHPESNIKTGVKYIAWLENFWSDIKEPSERTKFILASYNAGEGHVKDAQRLAQKYGYNPKKWDGNVEFFLLNKSKPQYYLDPVCRYGYCRGSEPFYYIRAIIKKYSDYKSKYSAEGSIGTNLYLDDLPDYGIDVNTFPSGGNPPLFQRNEVFKERTLLKDTNSNTLRPRHPNRIERRKNPGPSNQLFRRNNPFQRNP